MSKTGEASEFTRKVLQSQLKLMQRLQDAGISAEDAMSRESNIEQAIKENKDEGSRLSKTE